MYKVLVSQLNAHFIPKKNTEFECDVFRHSRPALLNQCALKGSQVQPQVNERARGFHV
ncbi:hypothetical protein SK128_017582 [Halocaridina rubra]|uniref:Uncharacterized protein n=1 Tax=Halocaridina rubra TaxID=373956 RepID=A0AAN8XD85_HALRR